MKFLSDGNVDYNVNDLIDMMKSGIDIDNLFSSDKNNTNLFNDNLKIFEDNIQYDFSKHEINNDDRQDNWFIPEEYLSLNIDEFIFDKCLSEEEIYRVEYELNIFKKHNLEKLLKFIAFLVDTMRKMNCVWGVGRGSSTCSYVLFLLGIHKINSIKYNLDFNEFLT